MIDRSLLVETPTEESGPAAIVRKAVRGGAALGIRQLLVQGFNVVGGILLARILSPGEFGVYAVITFILTFLIAFGDVGLGASLVRQRHEPTTRDFRTIFTIQQGLVLLLVTGFWIVAPQIAEFYDRPAGDEWLFRIVALSLLVTSLQSIPAIRLERRLDFGKLAVVEVSQAVAFNSVAVVLAWNGLGAASVAIALLARSIVGAVLANGISRWSIGWAWDWPRVRKHLRFGLPYQGVHFVSLLKDSITPVFVGMLLGAQQVGYLNWAGMIAAYPVLVLGILQRVYLPAFSRMRDHPRELARFVERVIQATNLLVAPLAALTLVFIVPITTLVFGEKWLPALPYFYLLWAANLFVPTAAPLLGLLNSLGLSKLSLRFAVVWMVGTWLVGAPLIMRFGAIGFAIANLTVQFTNVALYRAAQARVDFRILRPILPAWLAATAAGALLAVVSSFRPPSTLFGLGGMLLAGALTYLLCLGALYPEAVARVATLLRGVKWLHGFQSSSTP